MRTASKMIEYADLIGIPFKDGGASKQGANCVGIGRLALERLGAVLAPGDLPLTPEALVASVLALEADPSGSAWEHIGDHPDAATQLGDVVVSRSGGGSHVAVLVDASRRIVLTAAAPIEREVTIWVDEDGEPFDLEPDEDPDGLTQRTDRVLVRAGGTFACRASAVRGVVGVYRLKQLGAVG